MVDWFISIIDKLNSTFTTNIILMLLVFGGMYFLLIRLLLTRGYKIILKPKLTRKEYDIFLEQRLDLVFGGINKRSLGRFWRWLLCKCYPKKLQGRCYKLFVIYNYIYKFFILFFTFHERRSGAFGGESKDYSLGRRG